jgi:NTP pyrophosphatase (non-canonical NTP hydrolase)
VNKGLQTEAVQWLQEKYKHMDFDTYQEAANETAIYRDKEGATIFYPALGLAGEAGEIANKIKKIMRDGITGNDWKESVAMEIGDVMWYCAVLATDLGYNLSYIAGQNQQKLAARKQKGTISGSGDYR